MVPGLKEGVALRAVARLAVGPARAKAFLGNQWQTGFIRGKIVVRLALDEHGSGLWSGSVVVKIRS